MSDKHINKAKSPIALSGAVRSELYLPNGIAYIEAQLKLSHLRILIAIIAQLQKIIQYRISHRGNNPSAILPPAGPMMPSGKTRKLIIPLSAFSLGHNNTSKLRQLLSELEETRIIFSPSRNHPSLQSTFPGLISAYSFPNYARNVEILLPEDLTWRLIITEDGYTTFPQREILSLTNKYTLRIYWLISAWRNRGGFIMRVSELRRILCLRSSYSRTDNLIARVLAPAESELKSHFPIWFHYRLYTQPTPSSLELAAPFADTHTPESPDIGQNNYQNNKNGCSPNSQNKSTETNHMIVFKIHLRVTQEQRSREMAAAWDYCFNLMASIGGHQDTLRELFARLDYEDLRPFMEKLSQLVTYVRTHSATIQNPDRYILSALDPWFTSWYHRYK